MKKRREMSKKQIWCGEMLVTIGIFILAWHLGQGWWSLLWAFVGAELIYPVHQEAFFDYVVNRSSTP